MYTIRNWEKFQHYKKLNEKNPAKMHWFKLYGGDILDDLDYGIMSDTNKIIFIELLCLASQDLGRLPSIREIAYRLRRKELLIKEAIHKHLYKWIILEKSYKPHRAEKEKENSIVEIEKSNNHSDQFNIFWGAYPRKVGKANAEKAWVKSKPPIDIVLKTLLWQIKSKEWFQENGKYIPHPTTWINSKRWLDEQPEEVTF
jgi:hypothetical protein